MPQIMPMTWVTIVMSMLLILLVSKTALPSLSFSSLPFKNTKKQSKPLKW